MNQNKKWIWGLLVLVVLLVGLTVCVVQMTNIAKGSISCAERGFARLEYGSGEMNE